MTLAELFDPLLSLRAMRSFSASFLGPLIPYSSSDFEKMADDRARVLAEWSKRYESKAAPKN